MARGSGRVNRSGVAYDMRTGFKVTGRRLRQDAYNPAVWTDEPDLDNPQRFVRSPGPDNRRKPISQEAPHQHNVTLYPGIAGALNQPWVQRIPQLAINPRPQVLTRVGP